MIGVLEDKLAVKIWSYYENLCRIYKRDFNMQVYRRLKEASIHNIKYNLPIRKNFLLNYFLFYYKNKKFKEELVKNLEIILNKYQLIKDTQSTTTSQRMVAVKAGQDN